MSSEAHLASPRRCRTVEPTEGTGRHSRFILDNPISSTTYVGSLVVDKLTTIRQGQVDGPMPIDWVESKESSTNSSTSRDLDSDLEMAYILPTRDLQSCRTPRSDPVNQRLTKPPDIASLTDNLDGKRDPSNRKSNRDFDRGGGADRSAESGVVTALPADRGISNSVLHSIEATFIDAGMRGENEVIASDSSDTSSQYSYSESLYDFLASMDEDRSFALGGGNAAEQNAVGLELQ